MHPHSIICICTLILVGLISQTKTIITAWLLKAHSNTHTNVWQLASASLTHFTTALLLSRHHLKKSRGEKTKRTERYLRKQIGRGFYSPCTLWLQAVLQVTNTSVIRAAHLVPCRWEAMGETGRVMKKNEQSEREQNTVERQKEERERNFSWVDC